MEAAIFNQVEFLYVADIPEMIVVLFSLIGIYVLMFSITLILSGISKRK